VSLLDRHPGSQAGDDAQEIGGPPRHAVGVDVVRNECFCTIERGAGGQNRDDASRDAVDRKESVEDRRVGAEGTAPERVRDDDLRLGACAPIVPLEPSPECRIDPEHREEIACDSERAHTLRLSLSRQCQNGARVCRRILEYVGE
jgi:hypothetical protein